MLFYVITNEIYYKICILWNILGQGGQSWADENGQSSAGESGQSSAEQIGQSGEGGASWGGQSGQSLQVGNNEGGVNSASFPSSAMTNSGSKI